MNLADLETPALILDHDKFNHNVARMMHLLKNSKAKLRPHFKTHKCTAIARKLIAAGAKGITCAKLGEAEVLAEAGIKDILIANQIVQPAKIERLAQIAKRCRLTVCVDDEANIKALACAAKNANATIYCYVELDVGMGRCGVDNFADFFHLARTVQQQENLVFAGIQAYAGHNAIQPDKIRQKEIIDETQTKVKQLKEYLEQRGIIVNEISGGSTGTAWLKSQGDVYTEIQAGSYVYMDASYGTATRTFENALFILSTVISKKADLFVTDIGLKSCSVEFGPPRIKELPGIEVKMSEEHATAICAGHNLKTGDKLMYIPSHCCTTVNLHDLMYVIQDGEVIETIEIDGRGKFV